VISAFFERGGSVSVTVSKERVPDSETWYVRGGLAWEPDMKKRWGEVAVSSNGSTISEAFAA
jgi:hypothetical protein